MYELKLHWTPFNLADCWTLATFLKSNSLILTILLQPGSFLKNLDFDIGLKTLLKYCFWILATLLNYNCWILATLLNYNCLILATLFNYNCWTLATLFKYFSSIATILKL